MWLWIILLNNTFVQVCYKTHCNSVLNVCTLLSNSKRLPMGLECHVARDETWHDRGYPVNRQVMPYNKGTSPTDHLKSIQFVRRSTALYHHDCNYICMSEIIFDESAIHIFLAVSNLENGELMMQFTKVAKNIRLQYKWTDRTRACNMDESGLVLPILAVPVLPGVCGTVVRDVRTHRHC